MDLPAPTGSPYRIAIVCLGNICRSPMAAVVLTELLDRAGLSDEVEVASAGTGDWHVGSPMDPRAAATLLAGDYDPTGHRARQFDAGWFDHDLILAMDADNYRNITALGPPGPSGRVAMFRDFDPIDAGTDVPDPYYGGEDGFDNVLEIVERTSRAIVTDLGKALSTEG